MVGSLFRLIISSFLSDYFSTFIIKHPFLSNPFDSIVVLVSLLLLRDSLTIFMLSRTVLKVTFTLHFTISTHRGRAYKSLTNIGPFFPWIMKPPMNIWEVHHLFKRIFHESIWKQIITKHTTPKRSHDLVHLGKRIASPPAKDIKLMPICRFSFASVTTHLQLTIYEIKFRVSFTRKIISRKLYILVLLFS